MIYAVDGDGRPLRYVDGSQTGDGDVSSPQVAQAGSTAEREEIHGGMQEARARSESLQAQLDAAEDAMASCLGAFDHLPGVVIGDLLVAM